MAKNDQDPKRRDIHPANRDRSEAFRELAHALLRHISEGLLKRDFLPKVALELLEYSRCDAIELRLMEEENRHYQCTARSKGKPKTTIQMIPRPLGEGEPATAIDRLCRFVMSGRMDAAEPRAPEPAGLWSGDIFDLLPQDPPSGGKEIDGEPEDRDVCRSLALIPIILNGACIGILILKSSKSHYFNREAVAFYDNISDLLGIALAYKQTQIQLRERIKELTCLYGIAQAVARADRPLDKIMQEIVERLPPGWLFPEIASARIMLDGHSYATPKYRKLPYRLTSEIVAKGEVVGFVEVAYREKKLDLDEGPFLKEERNLIDIIAREVGIIFERKRAEQDRLLLQEQLRHADRLATIGQLAAGVAHELNEPLGNILGFTQLVRKNEHLPAQVDKDMDKIESAALHAREIIKKLMVFARQLPPKKVRVDLNELVEESLYLFEARCARSGIKVVRQFAPDLPTVTADPGQLNQVLVNLVVNAIHAMPKGGSLEVETRAGKKKIWLVVKDTGSGMSAAVKRQIFDPFFTTKDVNEGTGLGLAVVHGIVTSHQGRIIVESKPGSGSRFRIQLPLTQPDTAEEDGGDDPKN